MPDRTLSFAYTACVVFAVLVAFLLAATAERTIYVLDDAELIWITENDGAHATDEVARTVQEVADAHGAAIGYSVLDVDEPSSKAHMYLAVSDPDSRYADWLRDGYPSFGRGFTVQTHPITDFGRVGPNGYYLLFGAPEAEPALRAALAEHGLHEAPGTRTTRLWHFFSGGPLLHLVVIALLGTMTATGAGVLLGSREHAVKRLHGWSRTRVLLSELIRIARLWAIVLPVTAILTLILLWFYNGGNQFGFHARLTVLFLVVFTLPCLVVHACALALSRTVGILPALEGRLPVLGALVAINAVRIPALVLTLVVLGTVVSTAQSVRDQRSGLEVYERYGDTSRPALSADYGWADAEAVDGLLGPWLRRVDVTGDMVLSVLLSPGEFLPVGADPPVMDTPILVVNDGYLRAEEVLSPTGERYGPDESVRLLLPGPALEHEADLRQGAAGWLAMNGEEGREPPRIETAPLADDRSVFVYGAQERLGGTSPLVEDPVLVVLPAGRVLSDSGYVDHMSARQTIFPDPDVVETFRSEDPWAARYISMVETLATSAHRTYDLTSGILRDSLLNLVGAGAILLLTAMAACVVHVRVHAQRIFARHLCGHSFLTTHRRLLAVETAIALGFVGWTVLDVLRTGAGPHDLAPFSAPDGGAGPLHAVGIVLLSLALTLGTLLLFHRRIVREGSSQA
ncbi:bacteriocin-associated integral membrane family protein [Nocardiopsis alba]|uniref:bacteriocin-associated integral membrane family protein n=1 Tax=Nocardiopsis alba TaxID=53437 RepID=UPI0033C18588